MLSVWFILSLNYLITSVVSYSVLSVNNTNSQLKKIASRWLIKGKHITFTIKAVDNYLGIVDIGFEPESQPIADQIYFRLREKGSNKWYYENLYDTRQFYAVNPYPFGFPIIDNSKNKTYEIQLESLKGTENNSVQIASKPPIVGSRYKYPRSLVLKNWHEFIDFFAKKIYHAVRDGTFFFSSFIYFLPLLIYLVLRLIIRKYFGSLTISLPHKPRNIVISVGQLSQSFYFGLVCAIVLLTLTDIFFVNETLDTTIIVVVIMWFVLVKRYPFVKQYVPAACFILFLASIVFSVLNLTFISGKYAVWTYIYFAIAVVQEIILVTDKS